MVTAIKNDTSLVIFDLDGVLVDAQGTETKALQCLGRDMGITLPDDLADELFSGKRLATCIALLEEFADAPAPDDAVARVRATCEAILRTTLRPVPGIEDALDRLDWHKCVASNSPLDIIHARLESTGLSRHFGSCTYSAYDVGVWKPDPGLFLWAASQCGYSPEQCVVIEDSPVGVQAAVSAEIPVLHYSTGNPAGELGATAAFSDIRGLPELLDSQFNQRHI